MPGYKVHRLDGENADREYVKDLEAGQASLRPRRAEAEREHCRMAPQMPRGRRKLQLAAERTERRPASARRAAQGAKCPQRAT